MTNPMPTFSCFLNGEFQGFIRAVSHRQAKGRARKRYGHRVDVIGCQRKVERSDSLALYGQSRVGPALV